MFYEYLLRQEKPNIDRKDVALMMYQRGLGLLDLALCVDSEVTPRRQKKMMRESILITFAGRGTSLGEGQDDADQDGQDERPRGVQDTRLD